MTIIKLTPAQKVMMDAILNPGVPPRTSPVENEPAIEQPDISALQPSSVARPFDPLRDWDRFSQYFPAPSSSSAVASASQSQQSQQRRDSPPPQSRPPSVSCSSGTIQAQEQIMTLIENDEAPLRIEKLVLPVQNGIRVTKQFLEQVTKEPSSSRLQPVSSKEYKLECIGAIGRDNRNRVRLCIKWKGCPWDEATWALLKDVPEVVKNDLVAIWGPLGNIRGHSKPLSDMAVVNDEDGDDNEDADDVIEEPPRKKPKITHSRKDRQ